MLFRSGIKVLICSSTEEDYEDAEGVTILEEWVSESRIEKVEDEEYLTSAYKNISNDSFNTIYEMAKLWGSSQNSNIKENLLKYFENKK